MDISYFLAQLIGLYFIIAGIFLVTKKPFLEKAISEYLNSPSIILFTGFITVVFGLWIVLIHHKFSYNWNGLITLIGFLILAKGIIRLFFMNKTSPLIRKWAAGNVCRNIGIVMIVVGLFLAYKGFYY